MITHVAEAAEARGRVVLRLTAGQVQLAAIDAAVRLARAYGAEIESLYIENVELLRLATYSFAAEIPALGGRRRPLSVAAVERDMRLQFSSLLRLVKNRAALADVPVHVRVVRDEQVAAVASTCTDCGPWNVVVLTDPLATLDPADLDNLFAWVADTTGVMVVGQPRLPDAAGSPTLGPTPGPVVLAVEQADALTGMLHTAERLVEGSDTPILILLVGDGTDFGPDLGQTLDTQVRLILSERPPHDRADGGQTQIQLFSLSETHGEPAVIAEVLRRLVPSFLIARFGGLVVPPGSPLRLLGSVLQCPLLLIR
jgi:hypothetical protein